MHELIIWCTCQLIPTLEVDPTHSHTHTTHHTGAVYPSGDGDVGPCRPMSALAEGKYFHCWGIFSRQQSDRALAGDRRFPGGPWPPERRGERGAEWCSVQWGGGGGGGLPCSQISGTRRMSTPRGAGPIAWGRDVTDERQPLWYRWFYRWGFELFSPLLTMAQSQSAVWAG